MNPPTDEQFREAATRIYAKHDRIWVGDYARVARVPGGAFVELVAWVPDANASKPDEKPDA